VATSIDYSGVVKRIIIPQADLTLISGTLYELDTEVLRDDLKALEDDELGIAFSDTHRRNAPVTVGGETFAQSIEILNDTVIPVQDEYEIFFSPDTTYSVKLVGSNNNLFDIQNAILANTVTQVIPSNSAGLIIKEVGSAVLPADITAIKDAIFDELMEGTLDFRDFQLIMGAALGGKASGMETTSGIFRNPSDTKNRISVTFDEFGNRTAITFDLT